MKVISYKEFTGILEYSLNQHVETKIPYSWDCKSYIYIITKGLLKKVEYTGGGTKLTIIDKGNKKPVFVFDREDWHIYQYEKQEDGFDVYKMAKDERHKICPVIKIKKKDVFSEEDVCRENA